MDGREVVNKTLEPALLLPNTSVIYLIRPMFMFSCHAALYNILRVDGGLDCSNEHTKMAVEDIPDTEDGEQLDNIYISFQLIKAITFRKYPATHTNYSL